MNNSMIYGKNVVVTGTFPGKLRSVVEDTLTARGAIVQKSVGFSTDYLFCGNKVGATKTRAAEQRGVKMLNLDDYNRIIAGEDIATPEIIKPKLTHEEYIASIPETYGDW